MGLVDPPGFRRNRHGKAWLHLGDSERAVMGDLLNQMQAMLAEPDSSPPVDPLEELVGIDPSAQRPEDPALARLFPDAYEDPEAADEFRRFTQRDLKASKVAHLSTAQQTLARQNPTQLSEAECLAWLGALNDLRLTLGARLDLTEDNSQQIAQLPNDDPRRGIQLVYDWLTYHQDRLIRALQKGIRS